VKSELVEDLMGYNIEERSEEIFRISQNKWICRKEGRWYKHVCAKNGSKKTSNLCKNQPKAMIKYINMQTSICPRCQDMNITTRCSTEHLELYHGEKIDSVSEIIEKVTDVVKEQKIKKKKKHENIFLTRKNVIEYAESLIQPNIEKLKRFLNMKQQTTQQTQV
jgi:hypothetical protein